MIAQRWPIDPVIALEDWLTVVRGDPRQKGGGLMPQQSQPDDLVMPEGVLNSDQNAYMTFAGAIGMMVKPVTNVKWYCEGDIFLFQVHTSSCAPVAVENRNSCDQ